MSMLSLPAGCRNNGESADQSARSVQAVLVIGQPLGLSGCWQAASASAGGAGTPDRASGLLGR